MVDNVNNDLSARRALAREIAQQLNTKDGNSRDNRIDASIWNEFVGDKGGKTVTYGITLENAEKSISTYLARNAASGDKTVAELGAAWKANLPETKQAQVGQQPVVGQQPPAGQEQDVVTTEPRSQSLIGSIEEKYKNAEAKLFALKNQNNGADHNVYWSVPSILPSLKAEEIAYMLKLEPNFFENFVKQNFSPAELKKQLAELARGLGFQTDSENVDDLIRLIKQKAQEIRVLERPSDKEKAQRKEIDEQKRIATAVQADKGNRLTMQSIPKEKMKTKEELTKYFNTNKFATSTVEQINNLKLAIASGNVDITDKLTDLTTAEKRRILRAFIGNEKADAIDTTQLTNEIIKASKAYQTKAKTEMDAKNEQINVANNLRLVVAEVAARLKLDQKNVKQYIATDDSRMIYDEKSKNGLRIFADGSYTVYRNFDCSTGKGDCLAKIYSDGTIWFDTVDGGKYDVKTNDSKYYSTFKQYANEIVTELNKKENK